MFLVSDSGESELEAVTGMSHIPTWWSSKVGNREQMTLLLASAAFACKKSHWHLVMNDFSSP